MSYINYSPWQDAAQYGAGLGNTLGQILLSIPLKKAEFERERNRDRLSEEMHHAHAKYYDALTAAMPDKAQAQKDREQERMLHNIAIEDYLKTKGENTKADTQSKIAMRDANIGRVNANIPYVGPLANSLIALRGLLGQSAQMRTAMAPENAQTGRLGANANAALAGINGLPNIQIPQLPQVDPLAHAVQSGMGMALPPLPQMGSQSPTRMSGGRPLNPAGLNAGMLPTSTLVTPGNTNELGSASMPPAAKRFILRENATGKRFMGEQADIDAHPGRFTIMDVAE